MNSLNIVTGGAYILIGFVGLIVLYSLVVLIAIVQIRIKFYLKERKNNGN